MIVPVTEPANHAVRPSDLRPCSPMLLQIRKHDGASEEIEVLNVRFAREIATSFDWDAERRRFEHLVESEGNGYLPSLTLVDDAGRILEFGPNSDDTFWVSYGYCTMKSTFGFHPQDHRSELRSDACAFDKALEFLDQHYAGSHQDIVSALRPETEADGAVEEARDTFLVPRGDPLLMEMPETDAEFQTAFDRAAATIPLFTEYTQRRDGGLCSAQLCFRDPGAPERLGRERVLYLWLVNVVYHRAESLFSGSFFEVPVELQKSCAINQQLVFAPEEIFDWTFLDRQDQLHGGFTMRVARQRLPEMERENYDLEAGVSVYAPLPT